MMMVALRAELGDKLKTYNFSEAQDGKGPCDRRASHIKACVRRYINEGHDVTSAEEMKQAIDVKQKGSFRVKVVDIVTNLDAEKSQIKPITGITQLHNFSFDVNGITVWKAYGIGEGKRISWDNIGTTEQRTNLLVKVDWTIAAPQLLLEEEDGCTRAFKTQCALEQHIIVGNCDYHNEKTTQDKAKSMYGQKVNSLFHGTRVQLDCNFNDCRTSESVKGWALKGKKKRTVFSQSQVNYMKEKFDIGKVSGRKVDPFQAADEMRQLQEEGKYVFSRKDYLTGQQITAYFSRPGGVGPQTAAPPQEQESEDDKYRDVQPKTYQILQKEHAHAAAAGGRPASIFDKKKKARSEYTKTDQSGYTKAYGQS
ncbi:unnamed protein product [Mytilus coruscus]|uniref:Uncharacterized protein n=1 Tax=Mytilus coruscus TaxID=42192 RepID=A0A6J8AG78_MYTCO|nr:unnamed protein product [Mytilus coruscus]